MHQEPGAAHPSDIFLEHSEKVLKCPQKSFLVSLMQLPGQESWDTLGDALEESGTQSLAARQDLGGEQTLWDIFSAVFGCKVPGNTLVCPQQGHLLGPRAGHCIVPIDGPLSVMHRGADDWQPTACRRAGGTQGGPRQLTAYARGLSVPAWVALCHHPWGSPVLPYPEDLPTPAGSTYLRWCWQGRGRQLPTKAPPWEDTAVPQGPPAL